MMSSKVGWTGKSESIGNDQLRFQASLEDARRDPKVVQYIGHTGERRNGNVIIGLSVLIVSRPNTSKTRCNPIVYRFSRLIECD